MTFNVVLGSPNKKELCVVSILCYDKNNKTKPKTYVNSGYKLEAKYFNPKAKWGKWVRETHIEAAQINKALLEKINALEFGKKDTSFEHLYREYTSRFHPEKNAAILLNYGTFYNRLTKYRPGLMIDDLTPLFVTKYSSFIGKELSVNTVSAHLRRLKAICNYAIVNGYMLRDKYPFYNIKLKAERSEKPSLSLEELELIKNVELTHKSHLLARDVFVFQVYTMGMRIGDVIKLKSTAVNGQTIHLKTSKSKDVMTITLRPEVLDIIERYKGGAYVFPLLKKSDRSEYDSVRAATSVINNALKEVAKKAGITKKLTSHVARHTWTNLAINAGVEINIVSKALGHSSLAVTQAYAADVNNKAVNDANSKVFG